MAGFSVLMASRQNDNNHHALAHALKKTRSGLHRCLLCLSSSFSVHQGTASRWIEQQQALSSGLSSNSQYWRALGQLGKRCVSPSCNCNRRWATADGCAFRKAKCKRTMRMTRNAMHYARILTLGCENG